MCVGAFTQLVDAVVALRLQGGREVQVTEEDCLAVLDRRACDLVYRKAGLVAAEALPSHSAAGQILREGEIARIFVGPRLPKQEHSIC